ncbi:PAS domain S-box protein [Bacillus sp. V3B]|uniref:PAS domain S-box protein n=1 Tax=Bacillus sp. V3B TaxID=2804915 RepID=UPI0021087C3E|nr:PAS domain S-box protein [Bacillus sp. V3B]MCQ6274989.1 PAS domain S-box protein [Bacillus sp. V3B]
MQMNQTINKLLTKDLSQLFTLATSAFNSLQDFIYIIGVENEKFTYLFANQAGLSVLNTNQGLIGKTFEEVLQKDKADCLERYYRKAAKMKKVITFEDEVELKDGQTMFCETVLTPICDDDDIYIIAVVRDVTDKSKKLRELQLSKQLLEENEKRLSSLMENNEDAVFMFDREGTFLEVNPAAEHITGYNHTELIGTHFSQITSKKELKRVQKLFQQATEGETVRYESFIYHKEGRNVYLNVKNIPIIIEDQIIGVYGIARDITNEKKALEELHSVKLQLESFINDSTDSISLINLNGEVEFINEAFTKTFGYTENDVLGKENPIIPDWLKKEKDQLVEQVLKGKKVQDIHVKRQKKSGELRDISITLSPINDESGHVTGISTICRDITENKKTEIEMMKIKEELELVWNYSTDAIFMIGQDGSILQANPAFEALFGWNKEEIDRMALSRIYLDYQLNQQEELLTRLRENEEILSFDTRRKYKDGSIIDVVATYRPINKGKTLAIATYKNVTEEKRVMLKLKESEERYRKVLEFSPDALVMHTEGKITYVNQAGLDLIKAKNTNQVIGKPVLDFVHDSNRKQVAERIEKAIKNGKKGELVEEKYLTFEGDKIYVETASAPIQEQGKTSVIVMFRDITTKRRAEKALRESEERFRIIAEHSKDIIKILDLEGKVFYASPSFETTLGHPIRNVIGKSFLDQIHQDDVSEAITILEEMKRSKEYFEIDIRHVHQDGYSIWLHSHFIPVLSSEGDMEKIIVISSDITESKQKEEKLAKMAFYDYLTGLPNRRLFTDRLNQAIFTSERTGKLTALLVLDCDKFKPINDTYGHDIGDEVIKEFARRVRSSLRKMDTLARVGGDEFTIVLPELTSTDEIIAVSKRVVEVTREPMHIKGHELQITTSIGISFYPTDADHVDQLFKEADQNLYKSKDRGGNTFSL